MPYFTWCPHQNNLEENISPPMVLAGITEIPYAIGNTARLFGPPMDRRLTDCKVIALAAKRNGLKRTSSFYIHRYNHILTLSQ